MRTTFTIAHLTRSLRRRWVADARPSTPPHPDPFATLAVQLRLTRVASELRRLDGNERWAAGHHLTAATMAYDDLLAEAAELSDIEVPDAPRSVRRVVLEAQLHGAGWTW